MYKSIKKLIHLKNTLGLLTGEINVDFLYEKKFNRFFSTFLLNLFAVIAIKIFQWLGTLCRNANRIF